MNNTSPTVLPIRSRITSIGGELTPPAYYLKMPHFTYGWKGGCLGFQNSGIY